MASAEGEFPKIGNDPLFNSEVNLLRPVMQVYTGAGFDSSATNTTDTQDHELTAITSTQAKSAAFAKVKITGTGIVNTGVAGATNATVELKAQIKETGQSYADIVAYKIYVRENANGATSITTTTATYEIIATLTAGMKTNGFQIKVFSQSISDNASADASFTNIQTVQELA